MCRYGRTSGPRSLSFGLGVLSGTFCANSPLRSRLNMGTGTYGRSKPCPEAQIAIFALGSRWRR
jgi:hypothetical protein